MQLNKQDVLDFLPHRDPFLFIDSVEKITLPDRKETPQNLKDMIGAMVKAYYKVNEMLPVFQGHFPGNPIFPGVLQVEMIAQAASFVTLVPHPNWRELKSQGMLLSVTDSKFRRPVVPGDQLIIETELIQARGQTYLSRGWIKRDGVTVSEATVLLNFIK